MSEPPDIPPGYRRGVANSALVAVLARAAAGSTVLATLRAVGRLIAYGVYLPFGVPVDRRSHLAIEGSTCVGLLGRGRDVIVASIAFRWLTREPSPVVATIRLRETHTLGPFLRWFERSRGSLPSTRAIDWFRRASRPWAEAIERSRTVGLLTAVLEPGSPPRHGEDRER